MSRTVLLTLSAGLLGYGVPVGAQTISSGANQGFAVGDPDTLISTITITDDKTVTIQVLSLVKRAFQPDGTPIPQGSTLPNGRT